MQHPRTVVLTGLLAAGFGLGVTALTLKVADGSHSALDTALSTTTGFLFLLAGAVAHVRRPANAIGVLIALVGVALFLEDLQFTANPVLYTLAVPLRAASSPVIAHLVLAFPHGGLRSRWERLLVAASYLVVLGLGALGLLFSDDPRDLLAISADHDGHGLADRVLGLAAAVISAGVLVVLLYRWLTGRLPQRRLLSPVIAIALAGAATSAAGTALGDASPLSEPLLGIYRIAFCLWPLAFLAGVLRARVGNAEMIRLLLERDGTGLAALVQDDEVWKDSRSIDALNAAAGLVLDNQRLTAELEQRLAEVRASRARLVAAGDEERRRLERDLHDGAQQRLVSVVLLLRMANRRAELPPAVGELLTSTVDELQTAITELRELARGIRPAILTEAGLVAAVRSLADRVPMEVALSVGTVHRLDAAVEATAYYVTSEALTNTLKHAHTGHADVRIAVTGAQLRVEVTDRGVGGADPAGGSGLAGLSDRVQALGGELCVETSEAGTTIRAVIPLA
ncbi:sensor histidine kinase [Amycolatopsis sp. WQ 127309]|uniref:sensor histidine kinase n=1 Tax=Amycolatopsis sp. WQ 127309 TaxID=2932773 RepID=UPI001FF36D8E|nr:sensor histidine kinase [Amycolatopsis sp. WQ 127309]UOZ11799.1 sensor histidine kinase [Amycolatopsis sp. WQ 127309]